MEQSVSNYQMRHRLPSATCVEQQFHAGYKLGPFAHLCVLRWGFIMHSKSRHLVTHTACQLQRLPGHTIADPLSLTYETGLTKLQSGRRRHQSIHTQNDSNHKHDPFRRHRASHISKASFKRPTASLSVCCTKENVSLYDILPIDMGYFKKRWIKLKAFQCPL